MAHAVNSRFQGEGRGSGAREGTVGEVRGKSDACGCPRSQRRRDSFRKVEQVRCGLRPGASSCLRRPGPPSALEEQRAQPRGEAGAPGLLSTKALLLLPTRLRQGCCLSYWGWSEDASCSTEGTTFRVAQSPLNQRAWKEVLPVIQRGMGWQCFLP